MKQYSAEAALSHSWIPYILPFALFAIVTYVGPILGLPVGSIYLVKIALAGATLYFFRDAFRNEIRIVFSWPAILSGALVFIIWVLPDSFYPHIGASEFNPYNEASGAAVYGLMAIRLSGSALIVPIMEELFWRSFAMRFVIGSDFKAIPLGTFSWFSFVAVSVTFGFEHHRWLVGIAAGMIYAWILYRSKNLFEPILAHAVTNLMLGVYVILTGGWSFW